MEMNCNPPVEKSNTVVFTKSQEVALKALMNFIEQPTTKGLQTIGLSGAGGTGKTFLLKYFLEGCGIRRADIGLSTPSHKSARVLSSATGFPVATLHSDLGLRLDVDITDFDPNNPAFRPMAEPKIDNYRLYIIDEASMIPKALMTYVENLCAKNGVKLILSGDACQLPPTKESYSSAFRNRQVVTLTDIVRQELDNPVSEWLDLLRKDIIYNKFDFINNIYKLGRGSKLLNSKDAGIITTDSSEIQYYVEEKFKNNIILSNIDYCKCVAYTNSIVYDRNKFIRNLVIPGVVDKVLCIHDLLMAHSTVMNSMGKIQIRNSEDYIVHSIKESKNAYGLSGFYVRLQSIFDSIVTEPLFVLNHYDKKSMQEFYIKWATLYNNAVNAKPAIRSRCWKDYYAFKNEILLLCDIKHNNKTLLSKDLDYSFSITIHKSQGSTYNNVIVDIQDIIYGADGKPRTNLSIMNRLLYVGISRCKHQAILKL